MSSHGMEEELLRRDIGNDIIHIGGNVPLSEFSDAEPKRGQGRLQ